MAAGNCAAARRLCGSYSSYYSTAMGGTGPLAESFLEGEGSFHAVGILGKPSLPARCCWGRGDKQSLPPSRPNFAAGAGCRTSLSMMSNCGL
eukprot:31121-Chlamydomonas_euryale.AAC.7